MSMGLETSKLSTRLLEDVVKESIGGVVVRCEDSIATRVAAARGWEGVVKHLVTGLA